MFSSEVKAAGAFSTWTGGGALWCECRCAVRYPEAVRPERLPVKMCATECIKNEETKLSILRYLLEK